MGLTYGSVCSGIEAASVAWEPLGWRPAWFAEIDPFPSAVLAHRFPGVPNLGDFTQIHDCESIDLLVGGTPCQSFSVAGLRKGMGDDRGNLALEFLRLAGRTRPRWVVWENVPGVLSSNGGRDFGAFLGGLAELGYGWSYRVLDAQYVRVDGFGRAVPQRRRRVFVVGHLGDWRRAAAVLFDRESLSGNPPPKRGKGQGVAGNVAHSLKGCSNLKHRDDADTLVAHTLKADGFDASEDGTGRSTRRWPHCLNAHPTGRIDAESETFVACTIPASEGGVGNGMHPVVPVAFTFDERQVTSRDHRARVGPGQPCGTLHEHPRAVAIQDGREIAKRQNGRGWSDDGSAYTVDTTGVQAVAFHATQDPIFGVVAPALPTEPEAIGVLCRWAVRRLTPTECERLQGFPDGWTLVPHRGKPAKDAPRYKAIGNSFAVNVARWVGTRIQMVEDAIGEKP